MIQKVEREPTPLQKRLDDLGKKLAAIAVVIIAVIVGLGLSRGVDFKTIFLTAISMAVAAVPEGLPAVVTIALAIGAQRMLKKNALIRKLPAVETLGSVTVICSDKTGTLTENNMTAVLLEVANKKVGINSVDVSASGTKRQILSDSSVKLLLAGNALCNDAVIKSAKDNSGEYQIIGDPTESALVAIAAKFGLLKSELENLFPRKAEIPFDSERKRMTTIHGWSGDSKDFEVFGESGFEKIIQGSEFIAFTKGAVDSLLRISNRIWIDSHYEPLTSDWTDHIIKANEDITKNGIRVIGLAFRNVDPQEIESIVEKSEKDLVFVGMVGMIDPARPESKESVAVCKSAGIRPVMITGDHPLTARYIAEELGIYSEGPVFTGQDLNRISDDELEKNVEKVSVFARVSPEHKLRIVTALQRNGEIVAMTGDGVNDAPALKKADIGVAMGITGTDVSKEAAEMVLLDDNFSTIVAAVKEGRVIYDNTRKFFKYLITSNSAEIWVMLFAPFLGMPLPLLPLQILWINLLTDGLPAVALSVEPAEGKIMNRLPYHPKESLFSRGLGVHVIWVGILMALISLLMGYWYWSNSREDWQTMVFTTLTLSQMAHVLAVRSGFDSLFVTGVFSNTPLFLSVILTVIMQIAVIYVPFLQGPFNTVPLPPGDFIISILLSSIIFEAVEIEKWVIRIRMRKKSASQ
jgi:Ca2+-transporting ATPase